MTMRKIFLALLIFFLTSGSAFAFGMGARAMAMGGAYTALANDITAAYWNPAGLVHSDIKMFDAMAGNGIDANFGLDKFAEFTNPNKMVRDYWNRDADLSGNVNGIGGMSVSKIGISYIPWANVSFSKNAANTDVNFEGVLKRSYALTFGGTFKTPFFYSPISLGTNIRYVYGQMYRIEYSGGASPLKITNADGQGLGLDLGAQADIAPNIKIGLALRDLLTGFPWSGKTNLYTSYVGGGNLPLPYAKENFEETEKAPAHIVLGIASDIPAIALVSADIEYADPYSDVHFGVEKKFFMDIFALRVGYYTEAINRTSKLTYGCGLDLGVINADLAIGQDNVNSKDTIMAATISSIF